MRVTIALAALAATACQAQTTAGGAGGNAKGEQTRPIEEATAAGAAVEQGRPNTDFRPAFAGQTRAPAVKTQSPVTVTEVATGFSKPWGIAFLPDGRLVVTEKSPGTIRLVTPAGAKGEPLAGAPAVDARDQGGMLGIGVSPNFAQDRLLYWTYAEPRQGGNGLAMARARLSTDERRLENVQVIFRAQPTLDSTKHYGGRWAWLPDGTIALGLGERSDMPGRVQAQKLESHFGKVVKLNPDGSPASGNAFAGRSGVAPGVWSSGHRNPLGVVVDGQRLWVVEMGPRGGDELNLVQPGKDYGWPTIGYGEEYSGASIHRTAQANGLEQPAYYWDPVISPGGMIMVRGGGFAGWQNNLLIAGLSSKALIRLTLNGDRVTGEERLLTNRGERIRDVAQAPDGAIWVITDDTGKLLRLTPGS